MSSQTAKDTAVAASYAAARSVTRSPALELTSTKPVEDDGSAAIEALSSSLTRSPSPTVAEMRLKSTPPAEADHLSHRDEIDVARPSRPRGSPQPGMAYTTPQCPMTGEELASLRNPGDLVTTKEGHTVQLVEDGEGRRLFLSQSSSSVPPTSYQQPPSKSSSLARPLSQKNKTHKRISLLASMDPSNVIHMTDTEEGESRMDTSPTSSTPPSSYALRNRRAPQGKLVYDAKYHPMDDSINPSKATKRRSAHEEIELSSDDETETFSVPSRSSDSDEESDKEDLMKKFRPSKSKKRSRSRSESLQPTRRSSRRTTKIKVLYNMNVHPQDRYLEITSSDDDHSEASSHPSKRKKASHVSGKDPVHESMHQARALSTTTIADSEAEEKDEIGNEQLTCGNLDDSQPDVDTIHVKVRGQPPASSSPVSDVIAPPSFGLHRADNMGMYLMKPGERSLPHGSDSWPIKQGLPFEIHTERLEDQLAAEAHAASPLNFNDEDKENNGIDGRYDHTSDPTEGMSVIPVSQYRSSRADSENFNHIAASAAFYDTTYQGSFSAYNLGGSDGSHDQDLVIDKAKPRTDAKGLRTSSDRRLGTTMVQKEQKEIDSVLGSRTSRSIDDGGSVGEFRSFTPINQQS